MMRGNVPEPVAVNIDEEGDQINGRGACRKMAFVLVYCM